MLGQKSGIPADITSEDQTEVYGDSIKNLVQSIKGKELNHKPGDTFEYSNMNYDVLGLIIQNVSKESYNTYIKDHILEPLHMEHTTFKRQTLKISTKPLVMNNQVERLKKCTFIQYWRYTFSLFNV